MRFPPLASVIFFIYSNYLFFIINFPTLFSRNINKSTQIYTHLIKLGFMFYLQMANPSSFRTIWKVCHVLTIFPHNGIDGIQMRYVHLLQYARSVKVFLAFHCFSVRKEYSNYIIVYIYISLHVTWNNKSASIRILLRFIPLLLRLAAPPLCVRTKLDWEAARHQASGYILAYLWKGCNMVDDDILASIMGISLMPATFFHSEVIKY